MVATDPSDVLSTLIQRESVLYAVDVAGCEKRDIVDAVPPSRSTVDRSIRELEAAGLVTRAPEGYRRTLLGELLLSEYYRFKSQTAELLSAGEIFAELPPTQQIDRSMLDDATIITATQATPHQPVSALCSLVGEAASIRILCPAVFPQLIETFGRATANAERVEIILTDSVAASQAIALWRNLSKWGTKTPKGYYLRPKYSPKRLLEANQCENLAWKQYYRADEALEGLSEGTVTFFDSDTHGKMLVLHEQSEPFNGVRASLTASTAHTEG
jgi:hypothetical protein